MDPSLRLDEVLEVFARLEVEVRIERLGGQGGGLCQLRGKRILVVDLDADVATRLERVAGALALVPEIEAVFLPPAVRELLDTLSDGSTQ